MKYLTLLFLAVLAGLADNTSTLAADVVINEIMYHPSSQNVAEEYIELFNRGTNTVNLHGWRLTRGVDFTFTNVTLAPGGYLVVAADRAVFQAKYPGVANVVGNWVGALKNGGEEIELENATGGRESSVTYANEGDWGTRRRGLSLSGTRGWEWFASHDGFGTSLELINPNLPDAFAQNWASSISFEGTPGVVNSVRATDVAPLILDAQHSPAVPQSSSPVTITARIRDELTTGLSVALFYRDHSFTFPPPFASANMFDDGAHGDGVAGDGVYGVVLPALPDRTVIEFYIHAADVANNVRTWPAPAAVAIDQSGPPTQTANAIYQVDDGIYSGNQPIYRLVMTETERQTFEFINRSSDAQMNVTLVSTDHTATEIRYGCGLRVRGAGTRNSRTPHNSRLNIPNDRRWYGVDEVNLNSQFSYLQLVGSHLAQKAGMVSANARAVQVRFNGNNPAYATPQPGNVSSWQFGSYVHLEVINGDWAANHIPEDGGGNVYRASTGNHNADLSYGTTPGYFLNRGYTKTSNSSENDWSDLIHLTDVLNNTPNNNYVDAVPEVVHVQAWMRYFAVMSMLTSLETSIATGRGDDYSMYRGVADPRFLLLPHDLDTILGDGDTAAQPFVTLFRMINGNVPVLNRFMTNSAFATIYYAELKRMLDTTFSSAELNPLLDRLLGDWVPQTDIDRLKNYQVQRNNYVRSQIPLSLTVTSTLPIVSGYSQATVPTAALNGRANVLETRQVLVNGVAANWTLWQGTWNISGVALTPGINRILVQALDASSNELQRVSYDVWYNDGSVTDVSGLIPVDTVWTAAAGPYHVTASLTLPPYVTLTIEPGTTIYLAPGVDINLQGNLIAEGTESRHIRFTRTPGSSGTWNGLTVDEATSPVRIAYTDFNFADGGNANITAISSSLLLDHVTWSNTTRTILSLTSASLHVRDSIFPTIANGSVIQSAALLPGGFCIIERNVFGSSSQLNDVIYVRGAQRPGAILQVLNNVFTASTDDVLDLDGTDAHIEGNLFMRVHKNNAVAGDTSSAIAFGRLGNYSPHVVVARNIFYDVDHVALVKGGASLTLANNTAVGINIAALNFSEPELNTTPGLRAFVEGNVFFNPPGYAGTNFQNRFPTNGTVDLILSRNVFSSGDGVVHGVDGNVVGDARLANTATNSISAATIRSDFALRPGSPARGTGPNGLDCGALVPAGASISGEPPSPTALTSATLTVAGPGISNYVYRVNGGLYSSERPVTTPIVLDSLASGSHTVEVLGRNSAGVVQSVPTVSRTWVVNLSLERLVLNEVLAWNNSVFSVGGSSPDLVELYNGGTTLIDLSGMGVTDDPADPYRFAFPAGAAIEPGQYLVLYAGSGTGPGYFLDFGLNQDGDGVYLFNRPEAGGTMIDSVNFGPQLMDLSIGRSPASPGNPEGQWTLNEPTLGGANLARTTGDVRALKINEWLAEEIAVFPSDFVEIYNADSLPVNLGGLYLTDELAGAPERHQIAALSFIAPAGHLVFLADGDPEQGANHVGFRLDPAQGFIGLLGLDHSIIDCVFYGPQTTDISEGRRPSGASVFGFFTTPTPGAANPGPINTNLASLVINEVLANNGSLTNADGTITDWVELFNGTANSIDLSDMSLSDTPATPRRWVFPAGVVLAPGAYLILRCDGDIPATTNNGPILYTGFGLSAGGDQALLFDAPARGGALLDSITFGFQASDFSIGRLPNASGPWQLCLPTRGSQNIGASLGSVSAIRINEWLADPPGGEDDWFELYNPGAQPVSLGGLILTDNPNDRTRPPIPALSFIGTVTNGFVRIIADDDPSKGADHVAFRLGREGDTIALLPILPGPPVDSVSFTLQFKDVTEGRFPDGHTNRVRFFETASPGEANFLSLDHVVISEALTHTDLPFEDAIELQNLSSLDVDVSGWFLSDSNNDLKKFRIPDGTIIPSGGFVVFYEYQFNPEPGRGQSFSLSSVNGDQIYLSTANVGGNLTGFRATAKFGAAYNAVSFGRFETSHGADFPSMTARTLGADNPFDVAQFRLGTGLSNAAPIVGPIVIHEVMYHPPDIGTNDNSLDEFIELRNISGATVPLFDTAYPSNTWRLRDAVDFDFPQGTVMFAGSYLLLVNFNPTNTTQLAAFRNKYGVSQTVPVFGPYGGKLDNSSDSVELRRPDTPQLPPSPDAGVVPYVLADKVKYSDAAPWPTLADGNTNGVGYSLQRRVAADYGNDALNWQAGAPTGGAPTGPPVQALPTITTQPQNQNGPETGTLSFTVAASGPAPLTYQWRFNGKPIFGAINPTLVIPNARPANEGRYAVLVSSPAGAVSSVQARLSLQSLPVITEEPESRIVLPGANATFSVSVIGTAPLRYQWRKDGANLSGRTNATLSFTNIQAADEGGYTVVITNIYGSATSAVAQLTINTPPGITAQPQHLTVNAGSTANFSVTANGSAPLSYQWLFNATPLPGETESTLSLVGVQGSAAGGYSVRITNAVGSVLSATANLTVVLPPVVTVTATVPNASEAGGNAGTIRFTRSYVTNFATTVNYAIAGTATSGADYAAVSGQAIIPANQPSTTVSIVPLDDSLPEAPETVVLTIAPGPGYTVGLPNSATVTIGDNDNQSPTVSIAQPAAGTVFPITPTNILVTATASDPDGSVGKVEFFWQGTNKIGEATTSPYTIVWTNAQAGSNALTAVATDNLQRTGNSSPVFVVLNALPTISITNPPNNTRFPVPASIPINAMAADSDGTVTQVLYFANTILIGSNTASPYSMTWSNVPEGTYSLTAVARDNRGAAQASLPVVVSVGTGIPEFTDNFGNRNILAGSPLTIFGSNVGATEQFNEPRPNELRNNRTVWIGWTSPGSGQVVFDTFGSSFDTVLAVYTGSTLSGLANLGVNDDFQGLQSQVIISAAAGVTYAIQVAGFSSTFNTGSIVLHITAQAFPPSLLAQPQSQSVPRGSNATFSVTAAGTPPLSYQWRFNSNNIPGATAPTLTLFNVQASADGFYSVVVSNPQGSTNSANARLTVDDGLVLVQRMTLVPLSATWRYDQSGLDLAGVFKEPAFNDSAWPSGQALLGVEDTVPNPYVEPFRTPLKTGLQGGPVTTYYRTHFNFTNSLTQGELVLTASNFVDDGAVFYLNAREAGRIRMVAGVTNYLALGQNASPEGQVSVLNFSPTNLVLGDNVLAAEVHQSSFANADIVFGMSLSAVITVTNQPTLINSHFVANGFAMTLTGIAGREYAVDVLNWPSNWVPLVTFTNFAGQATFIDTTAPTTSRFYRGRLVR